MNAQTLRHAAQHHLPLVLLALIAVTWSVLAVAGTGGAEFQGAYDQIADFTQGFLGKLLTLLMILVGLIMGIARQSIVTLVVGVGMGIALVNAPNIVNVLVGATL